jgi:hypothetical protein
MEQVIEVPLRSLIDLLDLAETAVEQMRQGESPAALADALHGAAADVRFSILAPV